MAEHTAEPYTIETYEGVSGVVLAADGQPLFDGFFRTDEERDATRRRFVACVNACKGIPTEILETTYALDDAGVAEAVARYEREKCGGG